MDVHVPQVSLPVVLLIQQMRTQANVLRFIKQKMTNHVTLIMDGEKDV
jgi:hypothetical protein